MPKKLVLFLILGSFITYLGYHLGSVWRSDTAEPITDTVLSTKRENQIPKKLENSLSSPALESRENRTERKTDGDYQEVLTTRQLQTLDREMRKFFSQTDLGEAWTKIGVLAHLGPRQQAREGALISHALATLKESPAQSVEELTVALRKMPGSFSGERQMLIQLVNRVDPGSEAVVALLSEEMGRKVSAESQDERPLFSPLIALDALIQMGRDASEIETHVRKALEQQTNPKVREILLDRFSFVDKKSAEAFRKDFLSRE